MIDTDKYEGHTEGPWGWFSSSTLSDANKLLMADAPLLLAEVKRLREQLRLAKEWVAKELSSRSIADYREYIGDGEK